MARKKTTGLPKVKRLTMEEKMKTFNGDLLGDQYDINYLKKNGLYERTILRKARYYCFKMRSHIVEGRVLIEGPKGFIKFVESLPGFAGWPHFAVSWDIYGSNPFMVVLRLQSVWQEWDRVMERVSIPIDTPPQQLHERIQALTDEYARKQLKNN